MKLLCKIFGHKYTILVSRFQKKAKCARCEHVGWNKSAEKRWKIRNLN